jgi:mono/diheme cytochrome c family protein
MKHLKLSIVLCAAMFAAVSCGGETVENKPAEVAKTPSQPSENNPEARDRTSVMKDIYSANCALCHKEDGTGGKMTKDGKTLNVEDLTSEKIKKMADDKILGYINNGVPDKGMPAFKDKLSERDIAMLVRYVRVLQSPAPAPGNASDPTGSR